MKPTATLPERRKLTGPLLQASQLGTPPAQNWWRSPDKSLTHLDDFIGSSHNFAVSTGPSTQRGGRPLQ